MHVVKDIKDMNIVLRTTLEQLPLKQGQLYMFISFRKTTENIILSMVAFTVGFWGHT